MEDEVLAQDVIRNHLTKMGQLELLGVYRTAPEAQTALRDLDVDGDLRTAGGRFQAPLEAQVGDQA